MINKQALKKFDRKVTEEYKAKVLIKPMTEDQALAEVAKFLSRIRREL